MQIISLTYKQEFRNLLKDINGKHQEQCHYSHGVIMSAPIVYNSVPAPLRVCVERRHCSDSPSTPPAPIGNHTATAHSLRDAVSATLWTWYPWDPMEVGVGRKCDLRSAIMRMLAQIFDCLLTHCKFLRTIHLQNKSISNAKNTLFWV